MRSSKPFAISKRMVWEAFKSVKANKGAPGTDGQSIEEFEENLGPNLYRIWNRLASGTYFPPPVLQVEIPKRDGGVRELGIPTVGDRVRRLSSRCIWGPSQNASFTRTRTAIVLGAPRIRLSSKPGNVVGAMDGFWTSIFARFSIVLTIR